MEGDLVARLEAAVARLEIAVASADRQPPPPHPSSKLACTPPPPSSDPAVSAFDELVEKSLGRVTDAATKIGGKVLEATRLLEEAFAMEKDLLIKAKQCQKPGPVDLQEFLKPLNDVVARVNALTEGRRSDFFNHLKSAADSLTALGWIAYTGKDCGMNLPIAHVEESWQMAEFYNNKILVEYRNKDRDHIEWARALKELYLPALRDYVKVFFPLGLVWGPTGGLAVTVSATTVLKPPPPPPCPSASLVNSGTEEPRPKEGMSAVFHEISSGKSVTSGLRKVTDDMKTKNRMDKTGVVGATEKERHNSSFSFSKSGPPKLELQMGRKWAVENQIGKKDLIIGDCDAKQSVYVFGCIDSVLQIKGKVNNITIDKCTKIGIVFKDVVAACEIVNCNDIKVQCQGSAPSISIDNTGGCQLYLGKESLDATISTAKSSEINVLVPGADSNDNWAEHALPQQFVHAFKGGQFETYPASHSGG